MSRASLLRTLALAQILAFSACSSGDGTGTSTTSGPANLYLAVTPTSIALPVGGTATITVTAVPKIATPATAALGTFSWTDDCSVLWLGYACGDQATHLSGSSNQIACLAPGKTTVVIGLQASDLPNFVVDSAQATSVTCDPTRVDTKQAVVNGTPVTLTAVDAITGTAVSNPTLGWSVDNKSVVAVTPTGLGVPLSPGWTGLTATQTINGAKQAIGLAAFYVTGDGTCSLTPNGQISRTLIFSVQSDPGGHAAQIGFPTSGALTFAFGTSAPTNLQIGVTGSAATPFVGVSGGWVAPTDCSFVANGIGQVAGLQGVGVRLQGTWKNGALDLTYTVGTNGELSGGPTIYSVGG